jgi:hypothetical protein
MSHGDHGTTAVPDILARIWRLDSWRAMVSTCVGSDRGPMPKANRYPYRCSAKRRTAFFKQQVKGRFWADCDLRDSAPIYKTAAPSIELHRRRLRGGATPSHECGVDSTTLNSWRSTGRRTTVGSRIPGYGQFSGSRRDTEAGQIEFRRIVAEPAGQPRTRRDRGSGP